MWSDMLTGSFEYGVTCLQGVLNVRYCYLGKLSLSDRGQIAVLSDYPGPSYFITGSLCNVLDCSMSVLLTHRS